MNILIFSALIFGFFLKFTTAKTNFVLVMTDDQGWGQTGYQNHPVLKTPNLDEMATNGLCFSRFYAGGPVCSPTRASILTGRTPDRTGVFDHGYALRKQEKTLPFALKDAGYETGHFGKWHLSGLRGPGVPILETDTHGPKAFGFENWLSVTNFFDLNPIMSRNGKFEKFEGDSSEIIVEEALAFMDKQVKSNKSFFCVIWYGTPHTPWMGMKKDMQKFDQLDQNSQAHYAELLAMDRSIGTLRNGLRKMKIEKDTLVWFSSDNGGLPKISPKTTGGLRDFKGSLYEGGIRVPAIIEWPKIINKYRARKTNFPAGAVDVFPTVAEIVGLPDSSFLTPQDGVSLLPLIKNNKEIKREKPLIFRSRGRMAVIDNDWKLVSQLKRRKKKLELYDLNKDPSESNNLLMIEDYQVKRLNKILEDLSISIDKSIKGDDYPSGKISSQPSRIFWTELPEYKKYFQKWKDRPEFKSRLSKF